VQGGIDVDPEVDHTVVLAEVHPVDHQRNLVQRGQVRGEQLGQRGLGLRDEPPRHAERLVLVAVFSARAPTGFEPDRVTPCREPFPRHPAARRLPHPPPR